VLNAARPFISTDLEQLSVVWLFNTEEEVILTGIKDALMENQSNLTKTLKRRDGIVGQKSKA
jgi:hypothetical protein